MTRGGLRLRVGEPAREDLCPYCGEPVLVGLTLRFNGFIRLDPEPYPPSAFRIGPQHAAEYVLTESGQIRRIGSQDSPPLYRAHSYACLGSPAAQADPEGFRERVGRELRDGVTSVEEDA